MNQDFSMQLFLTSFFSPKDTKPLVSLIIRLGYYEELICLMKSIFFSYLCSSCSRMFAGSSSVFSLKTFFHYISFQSDFPVLGDAFQ